MNMLECNIIMGKRKILSFTVNKILLLQRWYNLSDTAVEEALSLPREATRVSHQVLAEMGNMSSPTVLFIVDRLRQAEAKRPCVALGFGPGLYAEAALFE